MGPDELRFFRPSARAARETHPPLAVGAPDGAVRLRAAPDVADLGGRLAKTWTFNGSVPGPELRLGAGQLLRVEFDNHLPAPTSIHWHGVAIRNDMDGVPEFTQTPIAPVPASSMSSLFPTPAPTSSTPTPGCNWTAACTAC